MLTILILAVSAALVVGFLAGGAVAANARTYVRRIKLMTNITIPSDAKIVVGARAFWVDGDGKETTTDKAGNALPALSVSNLTAMVDNAQGDFGALKGLEISGGAEGAVGDVSTAAIVNGQLVKSDDVEITLGTPNPAGFKIKLETTAIGVQAPA